MNICDQGYILPPVNCSFSESVSDKTECSGRVSRHRRESFRWPMGTLVAGQISGVVHCNCAQTKTCFWLALTSGIFIANMPPGVLPLHLKPELRLITSRSPTAGAVVYKTATPFGAPIRTLIMPLFAPILPYFSVANEFIVLNGLISVN